MNYKELPDITEKQQQIINLVYQYRFINRRQIQRFLKHKDPKRINVWLKDLVEKEYLGRIYSRKLLENTKPAIYYLHNNGILHIRFLKGEEAVNEELDFKYVKKFYKDKKASETFITHCIAVCEICLMYVESGRKRKDIEYEIITKSESWINTQLSEEDFDELKDGIPDFIIYKYSLIKKKDLVFFFEVIDAKVPRYAIRYKIKKFISLHLSGDLDKVSMFRQPPIFSLILSNDQTLRSMKRYIEKQRDEDNIEELSFILTTHEKILSGEPDRFVWEVV